MPTLIYANITFCALVVSVKTNHPRTGIRTPEQQRAWREKMGLVSIILSLMAGVGFLTFGFTKAVCGTPPNRFAAGSIETGSVIIHGFAYDLSTWNHPQTASFDGKTNPLFVGGWNVAGNDISFLFQNIGGSCQGLITKANGSGLPDGSTDSPGYYFPCNVINTNKPSTVNTTGYTSDNECHLGSTPRKELIAMSPSGQVYYTWDMVHNSNRNLAVFES
jgi:chitin synthase